MKVNQKNNENENRFSSDTKRILEKRAANICSSPNCSFITAQPSSDPYKALNLGKACHIKGANVGSARYEKNMTPAERKDISNGIWLCGNCHDLIDKDPNKYTVEKLQSWKLYHEEKILRTNNKFTEIDEFEALKQLFKNESQQALIISFTKGLDWEYFLIIELLRNKFEKLSIRCNRLSSGLEYKPSSSLSESDLKEWIQRKIYDISNLIQFYKSAIESEILIHVKTTNIDSDPAKILESINLFIHGCNEIIEWERDIQYTILPSRFNKFIDVTKGWSVFWLEEFKKIQTELERLLTINNSELEANISLKITLPDDFEKICSSTIQSLK
ncbi:hypothetical protein MED121_10250 [Marinomonas sp. MED121]|uniref:hypothetical protein n=1 Tax=Marinomonas sp. MED121 TaxID=314277 RepID=UPI000068FB46|nr:hypothetical protein [Marinomonas sp. MED121]EAQ65094.1 hypothetical protein MED121_10250 [Marinomonas sp. MED121]